MRSRYLLLTLVLILSSCGPGYIKPDPHLCTILPQYLDIEGHTYMDINRTLWKCVLRSDPTNEAKMIVYLFPELVESGMVTVSTDDFVKVIQGERDADAYIKKLENELRSCKKGK